MLLNEAMAVVLPGEPIPRAKADGAIPSQTGRGTRKFCVTISTLRQCQRWGFGKTRACWLGAAGMGCVTRDRLSNSLSVIISWIMTFKQGMFST